MVGSLPSYEGDISDTLVGASGTSSLCARCLGTLGIPLQSLPGLRYSSGVEVGTSGFLSSVYMDLGVSWEFPQGNQASSHVETCKSPFHPSCKSTVRLPVEFI